MILSKDQGLGDHCLLILLGFKKLDVFISCLYPQLVGEMLSDATTLAFWFDSWAVASVAGVILGVLEAARMLGCLSTPSCWGFTGLRSDSCGQATGRLHALPSFHPSVPQEGQEVAETPGRFPKGHLQENGKHWMAVCWLPCDLHVACGFQAFL